MKRFTHPNFILGIVSFIIFFIGIGMRANSYRSGDIVIGLAILIGAIHWIWAIVEVFADYRMNKSEEDPRILWLIMVTIVPAAGSMLYYAFGRRIEM